MLLVLGILGISMTIVASKGPVCDLSRPVNQVCEDFCTYKCSFYNASMGVDGSIKTKTLYRITPPNVTGILNKNTGDAPGDISFWLLSKRSSKSSLDSDDLYGAFSTEMSTEFGPYMLCNPDNSMGWHDTREYMCRQALPNQNGTFGNAYQCFCDGTARHKKTVGVELMPFATMDPRVGPRGWPAQCSFQFLEPTKIDRKGNCVDGRGYKKVQGWSFASTLSLACEACSKDDRCQGWATLDNQTATLFEGKPWSFPKAGCVGGFKFPQGSPWGDAGLIGGYWYSTPSAGECKPGESVGTNGCSWRVLSAVYKNASCMNQLVDSAVEKHGKACFDRCHQPLNTTSTCYLDCYRDSLLGHPGLNISKMPKEQLIGPWEHGFVENDPRKGGCPAAQPHHCEGSQCGPPWPSVIESLFI